MSLASSPRLLQIGILLASFPSPICNRLDSWCTLLWRHRQPLRNSGIILWVRFLDYTKRRNSFFHKCKYATYKNPQEFGSNDPGSVQSILVALS
ncbi:hypothetical protein B0H63DRAFT_303823 [Podospora didyma]|uniref:Uncharacterized protein n=1 Tax=Podospora didyma TaxID=330526 RepID=A0AAE0K581_9PEZI|nr:hypothetical protein B0H63DRAFT_303823 [Podospora didyma]